MGKTAAHGCRIVALSWDRAHEEVVGIVHAESSDGLVIREVVDLCEQQGLRWIRRDEVVDLDDLAADDPARRLAELRGTLAADVDPAPCDLGSVLRLREGSRELVGVYALRTGSGECLVGLVQQVGIDELVLDEVDPSGSSTGAELRFDLDEIIAVDWGNRYLVALAQLLDQSITANDRTDTPT